jgi:ABC-type dipeptide/oligopeptide/nickel transport system permease component
MLNYIIRRLLLVIPTLLGITVITFLVMAMAPGGLNAAFMSEGAEMKPEERRKIQAELERRFGLNQPLHKQYLRWLNNISPVGFKEEGKGFPQSIGFGLKTPDLGRSWKKDRPVLDLIREALPITLLLNAIAFPIIYTTSILVGIRAAKHRGKTFDVASGTIFLGLWSVPVTLVTVLAIGFFTSSQYPALKWFPTNGLHDLNAREMFFMPRWVGGDFQRGYLLDMIWHLVLPAICMTYASFAVLSKLTRGSVLENIAADYARTARAKGLSETNVLYRHVFHNSLLPLITVGAHLLPAMLSGAVIVETVFGIDGMGRLMITAVLQKDAELVLSETVIAGILGLMGYLIADICYAIADPRVKYD